MRKFDPTAVANYPLELGAFIFAAGTFPIPLRTEDSFAEQAVLLRPICTVVDSLGLANLTKRPTTNIIGAG
jgi:hypothetical protein